MRNMSILDYFTKNEEGKTKERVVKTLPPKEDYGIISGKDYIASKTHLIYTLKLKTEELRTKKKKR